VDDILFSLSIYASPQSPAVVPINLSYVYTFRRRSH